MQASRSTASLLADYALVDRAFFVHHSHTTADVKRSLAFYARHHMRITRMCLPADWTEPLVDGATGLPLLPSSLVALSLGADSVLDDHHIDRCSVVHAPFDGTDERWSGEEELAEGGERERQLERRLQDWEQDSVSDWYDTVWSVFEYGSRRGAFNRQIAPDALPHGLRYCELNWDFNQPLQVGSIPDTVEVLQLGRDFNQPLEAGHLPASLTHLVLGRDYNHPLLPGVLPSSLRRLHLGGSYNHPFQPGVLPPQLRGLFLGWAFAQPILPGAIPSSVTHLRLSNSFNLPLQPGSIPHGVQHLNLGFNFDHPLLPGILPTSLRELVISREFNQPLQPGSLPDGLELLAFHPQSTWPLLVHLLQPGILPASVRAVSLSEEYQQDFVAGGIPATVQWLRLHPRWRIQRDAFGDSVDLRGVLSPSTRLVWWKY